MAEYKISKAIGIPAGLVLFVGAIALIWLGGSLMTGGVTIGKKTTATT